MTLFTLPKNSFVHKMRRKSQHKKFIYRSIVDTYNAALQNYAKISYSTNSIKEIRKSSEKPYVICRMTQEDLHLLQQAKKKVALCNKFERRLKLLNF